ncbi:MAG: Gfo/Idh/MocA family oxidoreductase [Pseudomonadota bacterium]
MNLAILGCGYVADFYMATVPDHADLTLLGAYDTDPQRLKAFADHHGIKAYESFEAMLADADVEMVLNLTNPRAHYDTTTACLEAGKHVYSEKPLAMESVPAAELADLAKQKGLRVATAPCSMLTDTAQTLWKGIKEDAVGPIRLVYANFDSGMVHRHNPAGWRSVSGAPWPMKDEFEVGCTYEHAAYVLSWLAAYFGPARRIQSFASTRIKDKGIAVDGMAPDFTAACIEYDNDIVAKVTFGIVAPLDKGIKIIGENGILYTKYVRDDASPVYFQPTPPDRLQNAISRRLGNLRTQIEHRLGLPFSISGLSYEKKYPSARRSKAVRSGRNKPVDFMRGPSELAAAIREDRPCRLSPELGIHMAELIESLQYPERFDLPRTLTTTFDPIEPLPWR